MKKPELKEQALYAAVGLLYFGMWNVNQTIKGHMEKCEEASKNVKRVLWLVLAAVISEAVIKMIGLVHLGK